MVCYTADVQAKGAITCPNACASGLHGRLLICQVLRLAVSPWRESLWRDESWNFSGDVYYLPQRPVNIMGTLSVLAPGLVEAALVSFFVMKIDYYMTIWLYIHTRWSLYVPPYKKPTIIRCHQGPAHLSQANSGWSPYRWHEAGISFLRWWIPPVFFGWENNW